MLRAKKIYSLRSAKNFHFGIVAARYNAEFTDGLLAAALDTLAKAGARPEKICVARVPGSFEIPVVVAKLAASKKFDALLALGVVIRGKTAHADLIGHAITNRLSEISVREKIPVIHEVLLVDKPSHARERCLGKKHNRGAEAARTAIEMAHVLQSL